MLRWLERKLRGVQRRIRRTATLAVDWKLRELYAERRLLSQFRKAAESGAEWLAPGIDDERRAELDRMCEINAAQIALLESRRLRLTV